MFVPKRVPASSDALFSRKDLLSIVSVDLLNLACFGHYTIYCGKNQEEIQYVANGVIFGQNGG
jgi:hypothetical protein